MENELLRVALQAQLISVDYGHDPKNYQAGPMRITMKFAIPDYALTTVEGALLLKPVSGQLYNWVKTYLRIDTDKESRNYGFRDNCSRLLELHETLSLPKGYKMVQEAQRLKEESNVADFVGSIEQQGDKVSINQTLALKKRIYQAEDWSGFRSAVIATKALSDNMLVFQK